MQVNVKTGSDFPFSNIGETYSSVNEFSSIGKGKTSLLHQNGMLPVDRRRTLKFLSMGFIWGLFFPRFGFSQTLSENPMIKKHFREQLEIAKTKDTAKVETYYSTKPIHVYMGGHVYIIPANYFSPYGGLETDADSTESQETMHFMLFYPDFNGYTKDNWQNEFDHRRIFIQDLRQVNKNEMDHDTEGNLVRISPAGYGDQRARFKNRRPLYEKIPAYKMYGLEGYQWNHHQPWDNVMWVGSRSNGEFFFFDSSLAPGQPTNGTPNPLCTVEYYSYQEDLLINYRYSQAHIAHWREIDDAIWRKIHDWRVS